MANGPAAVAAPFRVGPLLGGAEVVDKALVVGGPEANVLGLEGVGYGVAVGRGLG